MSHYKPRHRIVIDVPRSSTQRTAEMVTIQPLVISSEWTRNNHLEPDELKITIDARDGGLDIRQLHNSRCAFWLWDAARERFDERAHLRFTGIVTKPERELTDSSAHVTLTFKDWTTLFREKKPFPAAEMPEWTDTLTQAWAKICDHTGYWDPEIGKTVSSVDALSSRLVFDDPALASVTLGEAVSDRFHKISKPTPKANADAWEVWQYLTNSVGLISWIDRDTCRVSRIPDRFAGKPPAFIWGKNVLAIREIADPKHAGKGVFLRSFDPLRGVLLESIYPPPGDPRVKRRRVQATTTTTTAPANGRQRRAPADPVNDYSVYNFHGVLDQQALDRAAREVYENRRRQELEGRLTTREMRMGDLDVLDLMPGETIRVELDPETSEHFKSLGSDVDRVSYLVLRGYREDVARVIVQNQNDASFDPKYHVESIQTSLAADRFDVEIAYHSLINI